MITSINVDGLYDELKLSEFNDKAMTVDGKPLALGNGKIISNPLFTSKNNLYTAGQCTWYVFDKRAQAGHTISTFGEMRAIGLVKLQVTALKSITNPKSDSTDW